MKCQNCGHDLVEGAAFCDQCGTPVEIPTEELNSVIDPSKIRVEKDTLILSINKSQLLSVLRFYFVFFGIAALGMMYAGILVASVISTVPKEIPSYLVVILKLIIPIAFYASYRLILTLFQLYFEVYKPAKDWPDTNSLKIPLKSIKEILVSSTKLFWKHVFTQRLHFVKDGKDYYVPIPVRGAIESQEDLEDLLEDFKKIVKKEFPISWRAWGPISSLKYIKEYLFS